MSRVRIQPVPGGSEDMRAAFPGCEDDPAYGEFSRRFHEHVSPEERRDVSFAVITDDMPCVLFECDVDGSTLGRFGRPVTLFFNEHATDARKGLAITAGMNHLDELVRTHGVTDWSVRDEPAGEVASVVAERCLARGARPRVDLRGVADLERTPEALHADLRKSYKSLVNWGRRHLQMEVVDTANPDREAFEAFRALHAAAAGRQTRSDESWDVQFEAIVAGVGELLLARDDAGIPVSAGLFIDGRRTTTYWSAAYDRSRFDRPLAHWPVYCAMLRSRERGRVRFDLGPVQVEASADAKAQGVARFKKGFTSRVETRLVWEWHA